MFTANAWDDGCHSAVLWTDTVLICNMQLFMSHLSTKLVLNSTGSVLRLSDWLMG